MTFEERCERFKRNTEKEANHFKRIYRVIFLNKKIKEYEDEPRILLPKKQRPKDHSKAKQLID